MAGVARAQTDGHVSSGVPAPQPKREGRSVERPAEGDGGTGPGTAEEDKVLVVSHHGNFIGVDDRALLGERGPAGALCDKKNRYVTHDDVYAADGIAVADSGVALVGRLGASGGSIGVGALGVGDRRRRVEYFRDARALQIV